jgi:uncharacterized protein YqjF (DUF2071 family)
MRNFLTARWENLIMVNYEISTKILQHWLPEGVSIDYYNDKTFVSLVGFMFVKTKLFGVPVPAMGTFEEINLRFYVTRKEGDLIKRGVVFINETVPHKTVAWLANKLYKERYKAIPTKHHWQEGQTKQIEYHWKPGKDWNYIKVNAAAETSAMTVGSKEEFILEHYYGYTRISSTASEEYKVEHPRWQIHKVDKAEINCDFETMYGKEFSHLSSLQPSSVMLAEGSAIAVKWKRRRLNLVSHITSS